jgi:biotin-(acetyl-CoA carboxylase) ligase
MVMIVGTYVRHCEKVVINKHVARHDKGRDPQRGTVITASYQESGRGQQGNSWEANRERTC